MIPRFSLLCIQWQPNPEAFELLGWSIKWYGITWMLSILSTYFLGLMVFRVTKRSAEDLALMVQYIFIGGLAGARLGHVLLYDPVYFLQHPAEILMIWHGGLASHGGMIGGMLALIYFAGNYPKYSIFWLYDHAAICILFLSSFIRFGNLMNSELEGTTTNVPWAFCFDMIDGLPRHPVVLYESIWYFLLQLLMISLFLHYKETKPGLYMATFFILVFGGRFFIEFFKVPESEWLFGLSTTQWYNIPFIIAGVVIINGVLNARFKYPDYT